MKKAIGDKIKVNMTLDKSTWDKAGEILSEIGISRSSFVNVTLTSLIKSAESPMSNVYDETAGSLFSLAVSSMRRKQKNLKGKNDKS